MPETNAPLMRAELRWCDQERGRHYWCIIENGKAYPFAHPNNPFAIDDVIRMHPAGMEAGGCWADSHLTKRSPPGTDEEEWLRQNDTRHPGYTGV